MRERADLIHAQLGVESSPGQGTRVVLAIPAKSPVSKDDT
jgi:signal transduction histidine kinase